MGRARTRAARWVSGLGVYSRFRVLWPVIIQYIFLFCLFQAEVGIRYVAVTGVQTCALPILGADPATLPIVVRVNGNVTDQPPRDRTPMTGTVDQILEDMDRLEGLGAGHAFWAMFGPPRSEERRGGKEGRSRWSPYH